MSAPLFIVLMISREGMETALMLGGISTYNDGTSILIGAALGLGVTAIIGTLWVQHSHKINLKLFMQVTGIFLPLFSIQLFIYGLHELSEIGVIPGQVGFYLHHATEPFGHDSLYADLITYSLLAMPCLWLGLAIVKDNLKTITVPAE